jgi:stearoyl-CoA desaturase (delta-9 desaturase)
VIEQATAPTIPMARGQRYVNVVAMTVPLLCLAYAVYRLWGTWITPLDFGLLVGGYFVTCLGISIGYHRYFTHRAFKTSRAMVLIIGLLGSMAVEGRVITWVADHRQHHNFSDQEGDPHSPHGHGTGLAGAVKGLWHAHMGWFFGDLHNADTQKYAKDLLADPVIRLVDRMFTWAVVGSLALPFAIGLLVTGGLGGGLTALLWGGAVRIVLLHHVTFSVNSICHFFGKRHFRTKDESRDVWWLALLSLGESWHNGHHAFPSSATHGLTRRQFDATAWIIRALERVGLVWDVVRIRTELRQKRSLEAESQ